MSKAKPKGKGGFLGVSIIMVIMSVFYFILPVDLVPEAPLGVVGWIDDAAIMLGSLSALISALPKRNRDKEMAGKPEGE